MLCLILNDDTPGRDAERDALRERHRAYLREQPQTVVFSGPVMNEDGTAPAGSVFLVNVPDLAAARAFSAAEPFTAAGLYARTRWLPVKKGVFNPQAAG